MATSEIEKLERRYAENPQGLTFAPLAEVYRKNGDIARALELLGPGLALHPSYIPASIVLGRCHLDLGDLPAAEGAFLRVLDLDGENVIALKALADITERLLRFEESERWLHALLTVDRSNDEAREQLLRVETSRRQAQAGAAVLPPQPAEPGAVAPPEAAALEELEPEGAGIPSEGLSLLEEAPVQLIEPELLEPAGPPPEGLQFEEPAELELSVEALPGLVGQADAPVEGEGRIAADFRVETSEDIVLQSFGASEFRVPDAAEELLPIPAEEAAPADVLGFATGPAADAVPMDPADADFASDEWVEETPPAEPEPPLLVTESMAELLLQQGHTAEALRVYRELASRSGGDPRLDGRIAELEHPQVVSEPAPRRFLARETDGQSIAEFFRALLAARPPAVAGGTTAGPSQPGGADRESAGSPTKPAREPLSLSAVFGEASPSAPPAVPGSGSTNADGTSFDEFFTPPGTGGGPRPSRSADPKNDDLDQFHAWLQKLKR